MAASGDRAMSVRPSGWTQRTVARQVEEWSGARSTRVERSDRPASALFVERLMEFAGPDDVFLSEETRSEIEAGAIVRSIGEMRINEWGEKAEAFRLLALVPAPARTAGSRGFVPGLPIRAAAPRS